MSQYTSNYAPSYMTGQPQAPVMAPTHQMQLAQALMAPQQSAPDTMGSVANIMKMYQQSRQANTQAPAPVSDGVPSWTAPNTPVANYGR